MNTHSSAPTPEFNYALNGYRGVCALAVFFYHLGSARVVPWPAGSGAAEATTYLWSSLRYGVEMFFMISGFVILGSLLRHDSAASFLRDRFIRIFSAWAPALIAVTAICGALDMKVFADVSTAEGAGIFFANLLLLPPVAPLPLVHMGSWSLTYEWFFYLTAAFGVVLTRATARRHWAIASCAGLSALLICLFPRAMFFLTGVLVFRYRGFLAQRLTWLRFPILSLFVFLVAWRFTGADKAQLSDTLIDWMGDARILAALLAFGASVHMFASVALAASRQTSLLTSRAFQFLGTISYSFYLWHALVMGAVKRLVTPYVIPHTGAWLGFTIFAVASFLISIAVSWISWTVFEVRLVRAARKFIAPRSAVGSSIRAT